MVVNSPNNSRPSLLLLDAHDTCLYPLAKQFLGFCLHEYFCRVT